MIKFLSYLVDFMVVVLLASSPMACYISILSGDWLGVGIMVLCFFHGVGFLSKGWRSNDYE